MAPDVRSENLKRRMAEYVLEIGQAIKNLDGLAALEKRVHLAARASADQKAKDLKSIALAERHQALAERLRRMLCDFGGKATQISVSDGGVTQIVDNPICPCLPPFVSQAEQFGFKPKEVRKLACMICMPSYARGAQLVGVKFGGKLTEKGCWMSFSRKLTPPTVGGQEV